jgi:hypothetical protein
LESGRPAGFTPTIDPMPLNGPNPGHGDCGTWEGQYRGLLTHRLTGRNQIIDLRLSSYETKEGAGRPRCTIGAYSALFFGKTPDMNEKVTTLYPYLEFVKSSQSVTLYPDRDSDGILEIRRRADGGVEGNYYSKFFGFVGTFSAEPGAAVPDVGENYIPSVSGSYDRDDDENQSLTLQTAPMWANPESFDPFTQVNVSGWRELFFSDTGFLHALKTDAVDIDSYDYFTNFLMLRTANVLLAGTLDHLGYKARWMGRVYNTPNNPDEDHGYYLRRK